MQRSVQVLLSGVRCQLLIGCRHDFYVSDLKPVLTMFAELRITETLFSVGGVGGVLLPPSPSSGRTFDKVSCF